MTKPNNGGNREEISRDILSDLGKTSAEKHFLEALLENGEVFVDKLMESDVVKDFPVLGTALKICKAGSNLRDYIFAAKIHKFITSLRSVSPDLRAKFKKKIVDNPEERKRVGEFVLLTIDKISDLEKPEIIAKIFLAYMDGHLTADELRRIVEAIDLAFIADLKVFLHTSRPSEKSKEAYLLYLTRSGLTEIVAGKTIDEIGEIYFEFSRLGKNFLNAYHHGNKLAGNKP